MISLNNICLAFGNCVYCCSYPLGINSLMRLVMDELAVENHFTQAILLCEFGYENSKKILKVYKQLMYL
jgi:hypothetical protein